VNRKEAIFAMLTFAFDAGGDDGTEVITVAGFASSANDWDEFSTKWKDRLSKDGVAFFRAVDAASFRGPFEHLRQLAEQDRERIRRALFADLMEIIKSHVYAKFSCTIINKEYRDSSTEAREQFAESAYSMAARTCERYARRWVIDDWRMCPDIEIACIFEAGDLGQTKLQERLRKDYGHIPPNFRPKKDTIRETDGVLVHGFVPLQAADWLAWELNSAAKKHLAGKLNSEDDLRWPMQEFLGRPVAGYLGTYTTENFSQQHDMLQLIDNIAAWETAIGIKPKRK
jgi:hypothetical protein